MLRNTAYFTLQLKEVKTFKEQMLNWADQFNICCFMDSNDYEEDQYSKFDCLLGCNAISSITGDNDSLNNLDDYLKSKKDWIFGHINFEAGYQLLSLKPHRSSTIFPGFFFFQPETLITIKGTIVCISSNRENCKNIYEEISKLALNVNPVNCTVDVRPELTRDHYLEKILALKKHIQRGDCYEINFCQKFSGKGQMDPVSVFTRLKELSPTPFSCYYKINESYLCCASPERFIQKTGNKVVAQPIKGTIRRNLSDAAQDLLLQQQLADSKKDRSENVMIVDLVRNDLSKIADEGTVSVSSLFSIKGFRQVYQMISTIEAITSNKGFGDVIKAAFPMGSMTGAPKRRVIELTDEYETAARGIYSGTLAYIEPNGDFDSNVVIRSIIYDKSRQHVEYFAGGGITWYSNADQEYEECLLKAGAMKTVLNAAYA